VGSETATPDEAALENTGALWEVCLEDTVIFPEGGGQPFDTGSIVLGAVSGQSEGIRLVVEGCLRRKLESVHLVRVPLGMEEVFAGAEEKEVEVRVDWERRLDQVRPTRVLLSLRFGGCRQISDSRLAGAAC
jgi:Ser-tRNA(Ala) deacylase AlaX